MRATHKGRLNFGNPLRDLVGNPPYGKEPSAKAILDELLNAMASFSGTCWAPVNEVIEGEAVAWKLMLNQCPGCCGHVWSLVLKDKNISAWIVNEINLRASKVRP